MPPEPGAAPRPARDGLLSLAALVVVIAGARYAAPLLQPFLLALFLAVLCGSLVARLTRMGWPRWLAITCVVLAAVVLLAAPLLLLGSSLEQLREALPLYQQQFQALLGSLSQWFTARGMAIDAQALGDTLNPGRAMGFLLSFVGGIGDAFSNVVMIILTVVFLLVDASSFPRKLAAASPGHYREILATLGDLVARMNRYFVSKALVSLLTAGLIWTGLQLLGVRFAGLWALLAFLLNFVPVVGSIIAAVPAVSLSILAMDPAQTLLLIALYVGVNTVVGNIIEPAWMGHRLGLSTLAVFLSLVFWGWVFGPVGMLLSVPLTMVLHFYAARSAGLSWLALLLAAVPETGAGDGADSADEPRRGAALP
ncbi:AI-2E family transporter [Parahaliea mediterranea]|uniref:AI-2E family transporter n=1 Tax=Parahaliea mediterranea TaxID=651086 RepID=UPI000E2E87A3|nr:AI-2E family transporter [Parahaliea mediterranea]